MIDFLLFLCVLIIFFAGVQTGASVGGIPSMIRWCADKLEGFFRKDKP
jgi:hypothetical protein